MRRLPLLLLLSLLAAVLSTAGAAPAWAHTRFVSSTPAQGAPAQAPDAVELVFSDPVQPGLSAVSVTGAAGQELVAGAPAAGRDSSSVSQALRSPLEPGTYRVAYRVLAADGHPVTGSFDITAVAPADATGTPDRAAPAAPSPRTTPTVALQPAAGTSGDGGVPVLPLAAGGLVVAGAAGLLARRLGGTSAST